MYIFYSFVMIGFLQEVSIVLLIVGINISQK